MSQQSWTVRGGEVVTPSPFALFGIVNLTPDSFSDGGKYFDTSHDASLGFAHAKQLWQEGAAILDLGAESSRPGALPLDPQEELLRLMPVLTTLKQHFAQSCPHDTAPIAPAIPTSCPSAPPRTAPYISIDTYHARTAASVLEAGAHIINDISACLFDPELLDVVVQYKPGYVLMHSSGRPYNMQDHIPSAPIMDTLNRFFDSQLQRLTQAGVPEEHILLDPGICFGKSVVQNWEILRHMDQLKHFGRPLMAALSMKSFLHKQLDWDEKNLAMRAEATHITTALLAAQGIAYHRVHHVAQSARALNIAQLLMS